MDCSVCDEDLDDSQYVQAGAEEGSPVWKSCPNCSRREGEHVFYPYADFGFRDMGNRIRVQSWCGPCRSDQPSETPAFRCSD